MSPVYVRARAVIPGYRTAAAECPACRGAHATPRSSRSPLLSRKHATPQAISRNATRNIRHPTGNTAAIRMPSPSPRAQIPRKQLPPPHRRTVYPSPAPVYERADAACMARGNVEDAVPYTRFNIPSRRAGPVCPAEKCVPGGGTHGSRPTGAYPSKKQRGAPCGRCRQAMSSAAARRRARRSERATGLFFTAGRMATPSSRRQGGSMARTVRFCWA